MTQGGYWYWLYVNDLIRRENNWSSNALFETELNGDICFCIHYQEPPSTNREYDTYDRVRYTHSRSTTQHSPWLVRRVSFLVNNMSVMLHVMINSMGRERKRRKHEEEESTTRVSSTLSPGYATWLHKRPQTHTSRSELNWLI